MSDMSKLSASKAEVARLIQAMQPDDKLNLDARDVIRQSRDDIVEKNFDMNLPFNAPELTIKEEGIEQDDMTYNVQLPNDAR